MSHARWTRSDNGNAGLWFLSLNERLPMTSAALLKPWQLCTISYVRAVVAPMAWLTSSVWNLLWRIRLFLRLARRWR
jgi:hypothetical protein